MAQQALHHYSLPIYNVPVSSPSKSYGRIKLAVLICVVMFMLTTMILLRILRKITPTPSNSTKHADLFYESDEFLWNTKLEETNFELEKDVDYQELTISQWMPIKIEDCQSGMYKFSAPCLQNQDSNIEKGIELIYHSFKIKAPKFFNEKQKKIWMEQSRDSILMKWSPDNEWAIYPSINGQILVFNNVYIDPIVDSDEWSENNCVGQSNSHLKFLKTNPTPLQTYESVDSLIISTSPDSFSFQHFLDRVTVVWGQATLENSETAGRKSSILAGKEPTNQFVNEIYQIIAHNHFHKRAIYAKKVIYSCRSPLVHPFTTQRISNEILFQLNLSFDIPFKDRKKIVYFTRSNGDSQNGGRMILNEDAVLEHLKVELLKRNLNEELVTFDSRDFANLSEIVKFFANVKAIFGPHGAAFYNSRFAPRKLAVLEILPSGGFFYQGFWEQASLLEQTYGVYYAQMVNFDNDMIIKNIPQFVKYFLHLVDECQFRKPQDILQKYYHWQFTESS
ncbi:predicted protein [Naegleria gruberi]|uniref:Predicted protein n=1 Tax=Naegleria gruberi TaxID=5762 RepID=D2VYI1_NAEGR|nr:uncharacterized protein NAEGRDRAFT_74129 [Naegleria gruberi]EFC38113.1 predicted protein [Naegleria gruberi]|eukprot:XP_002670857.1 predicted protein [Naegleria gruberi strain NEG-M]